MRRLLKYQISSVVFLIVSGTVGVNAQILHDSIAVSMIKLGINKMYNLEYQNTREIFSEIEQSYP
ncbi:MAG: hypothetical protein IH592_05435, partial [Bacteroidales bacterium]|nr:hypothetical protein [Bacteroidales bacterium]